MKTGIELIAAERQRQIEEEGYDARHDKYHDYEDLAQAAVAYAYPLDKSYPDFRLDVWPWDTSSFKPSPENRIKELVKAGALIAAAIDRYNDLPPTL